MSPQQAKDMARECIAIAWRAAHQDPTAEEFETKLAAWLTHYFAEDLIIVQKVALLRFSKEHSEN